MTTCYQKRQRQQKKTKKDLCAEFTGAASTPLGIVATGQQVSDSVGTKHCWETNESELDSREQKSNQEAQVSEGHSEGAPDEHPNIKFTQQQVSNLSSDDFMK